MKTIEIQILVENTAKGQGLLAEHGLAYHLNVDGVQLLFDTGQGVANVLANNARKLGVDLSGVEILVLSHGHYDHTGCLPEMLNNGKLEKLYAHPAAFAPKYTPGANGALRSIGLSAESTEELDHWDGNVVLSRDPVEIHSGLYATGQVPRLTAFEDTGGDFYLDSALLQPDLLLDDQSLFFASSEGTVVLLGCAHSGVVNTLQYIRKLTGNHPIHAVIGGMHLGTATDGRIAETIRAFEEWDINLIAPLHCTGPQATIAFHNAFPDAFRHCRVGSTFNFSS